MGFLRCGKRVSYKTGLCRYDSFGPKRVGFGRLSTRFAQVAAAFAGSLACGRCACERGAWEEGRGGDGAGAMGSCQGVFGCGIGDGDGPSPRTCPGFPLSRERRWGGAVGRAGAGGGGGPFDRLRANGISKRACDVGWWGRAAARRTSGYRLSPVRRWRVWEVREAEARRAAPLPWVPAKAGTTVGGSGAACRYCVGLPHPAPLDSCLRRNDARRRRPRTGPLPWVPAFARTTVGGAGPLAGFVSGYRTPPLWIPAFAGMTLGVVRERRWESAGRAGAAGGGGNPSTGSGRTESR